MAGCTPSTFPGSGCLPCPAWAASARSVVLSAHGPAAHNVSSQPCVARLAGRKPDATRAAMLKQVLGSTAGDEIEE